MLDFTADEIAEARRLNEKLSMLPRLRMQTAVGRVVLNGLLRVLQLYPMLHKRKDRIAPETMTVTALGRDIKLRVFRARGRCNGVVVDFHGGGWTIGNARMADDQNSQLVLRMGLTVVSVDYRLALSRPVADVIAECEAAIDWAVGNAAREFGNDRIVVKASSAGSHLSSAALLRMRDRVGIPPNLVGAVLYFGLYDFAGTPMVRDAPSDTLILHGPTVRATLKKLTPDLDDAERKRAPLSPVYGDLRGLPPALFLVGTRDILLEDNQRMAAQWHAASGNADLIVVPEGPHAFIVLDTAIARKVEHFVDGWMRTRLG